MKHETGLSAWSVSPGRRKPLVSICPKKPNCATRTWEWMELSRSSLVCEGTLCFTALLPRKLVAVGTASLHFRVGANTSRETSSEVSFKYNQLPTLGRNSCSAPVVEEQVFIRN